MTAPTEIWTMGELLAEVMRPERDQPLGRPGPFMGPYPSGAPGIFIDTVARLGRSGGIISAVGQDPFGAAILDRLARDGVRTDHVEVLAGRATGVAFVAYAADGSREFLFHWDGTPAVMASVPPRTLVEGTRFFHVMGCSLMASAPFRERIMDTVALFAAGGARITFDPNIRMELAGAAAIEALSEPVLGICSILLPGRDELAVLSGEADVDAGATTLFQRHPLDLIVVKLGRDGCRVHTRDGRIDVPAFAVEEVDPTGAGDCFDAGFLCGLLEGLSPAAAARVGAAAGALGAASFGPMEGTVSPAAVASLIAGGHTDHGN